MERFCPVCSRVYGVEVTHCELDGEKLVILKEEPSLVGHVLDGKYTLISKLGEGGMGSVYLAEQTSMGREVAIKVLRREFSQNRMAIKRFLREARAASKLAHPNTITVYDFGQSTDGLLYLVMERLTGRPLGDILDSEGRMPVERTVHIMAQVCDSLSEAHAHGITHRDLKPENIFIEQKVGNPDFVKVLDFGIAKMQGDDSTQATATGMICGTPSYMSPEQAMGRDIDGRSDIYALGILLYEMLTDEKPFEGDTPMEVMLKHINEPAPNILERTGMVVPRGIQQAVDRMLSKNATERPAHCQEVKRLVVEGLASEPTASIAVDNDPIITHKRREESSDHAGSQERTGLSPVVPPEAFAQVAPVRRRRAGVYVLGALALAALVLLVLWLANQPPSGANATRLAEGGTEPTIGAVVPTSGMAAPAPAEAADASSGVVKADPGHVVPADVVVDPVPAPGTSAGLVAGSLAGAIAERAFVFQAMAKAPPAPTLVSIRIESTPLGAQVFDAAGALIGETPIDVKREKDSGTVEFVLRKTYYAAKSVTVGTAENVVQHVELARARRPTPGGTSKPGPDTIDGGPSGFGTF